MWSVQRAAAAAGSNIGSRHNPVVIRLQEASGFFPSVWEVLLAYSEAEADAIVQHTVMLRAPAVHYSTLRVRDVKDQAIVLS